MLTYGRRIRRAKLHREAEGYLELGMPEHALGSLARLGNPLDFDVHGLYLWGEALRSMERYSEALLPLSQAAEAAPDRLYVWFALGWCYKRTGQIQLAIDSLQRVLAVDPTEPLAHYNLACYWSLAGNKQRALQFLEQALQMAPEYRELIDGEHDFDPIRSDSQFQTLCRRPEIRGPKRGKRQRESSSEK